MRLGDGAPRRMVHHPLPDGAAEGRDGGRPGGQGREGGGEGGRHGRLGQHLVGDGGAGRVTRGRLEGVDVPGRPAGQDGRGAAVGGRDHPDTVGARGVALVLEGGDLLEDVGQGLVLRPPVEQVVPVVAPGQLLLRVDDAEKCAKLLRIIINNIFIILPDY